MTALRAMTPLTVLGWLLRDYAYVSVGQFRAVTSTRDPAYFHGGTGRVVVIIPGFIETWQFMLPLIEKLHGRGHPVHVIAKVGWNVGSVTDAAQQVTGYLLEHDLQNVLLVTHSKGGLIGKRVMAAGEDARRVAAMVAIAGPFAWSRATGSRIVSIFSRFDPHIFGGSFLVGAKNVRLDTGGHFRVIEHPGVLNEIATLTATLDAVSLP